MLFLTADTHLGHNNIRRYCARPFESVEHMDEVLLDNINSTVRETDTLYIIGDFCFMLEQENMKRGVPKYRALIKCKHVNLVLGNHDPHYKNMLPKKWLHDYFEEVSLAMGFRFNVNGVNKLIYMHHTACRVWPKSNRNSYHAYGHSHGTLPDDPYSLSMDVGVDAIANRLAVNGVLSPGDYKPISVDDFVCCLQEKEKKIKEYGSQPN